jgi:hypothetical protein
MQARGQDFVVIDKNSRCLPECKQPLKLGNPGLVLAPTAIETVRSFGILGQLCLPSAGKTGIDAVFAAYLTKWFAGLKLGYY